MNTESRSGLAAALRKDTYRKHRSEIATGLWQSDEFKQKMLESRLGHKVSEETRRKIGDSNRGQVRTKECKNKISLEKGGRRLKALPLLLRGGSVEDIVQIRDDLKRTQVGYLRDSLRRNGELSRPSKEEEKLAKRKAHLGRTKNGGDRIYTIDQQSSFFFARRICKEGLIGEDLVDWNRLRQIFEDQEKELPEAFSDKLRLEIFLRAVEEAKKGDRSLLKKYNEWGRQLDPVWFEKSLVDAEGFIIDLNDDEILAYALSKPLTQYPEQIQETVVRLDRTGLGLGEKQVILTYLVLYRAEGGWIEDVAELLGISVCDARAKMGSVLKTLSEEGWEVMERLAGEGALESVDAKV